MHYDRTSRLLHWTTVLIVLPMIAAGLIMTETQDRALQDTLFIFHKNAGAVMIVLIVVRLAWRIASPAPPLPTTMPVVQRVAARISHVALYLLLAVMVISGFVRVQAGGFPIEMLDAVGFPQVVPRSEELANRAKAIHAGAKNGLIAFILLHVAAAAYHGLLRRDGVFSRMWPPA